MSLLLAAGLAVMLLQRPRLPARPTRPRRSPERAGELVALALAAGLPFAAAIEAAADHLGAEDAAEITLVLRRARRHGLGTALAAAGTASGGLFRVAHRAVVTGAPLVHAVESWSREQRKADHSRRLERVRTLPVRLLLPLTLLTLPGFVVLTVGPTLIEAVARLRS